MQEQYDRIERELERRRVSAMRAGQSTYRISERSRRAANAYTGVLNSMEDAYTGRKGAYNQAKERGYKGSDIYDHYMDSGYMPERYGVIDQRFENAQFGYKQRQGVGKWNSETLVRGLNAG